MAYPRGKPLAQQSDEDDRSTRPVPIHLTLCVARSVVPPRDRLRRARPALPAALSAADQPGQRRRRRLLRPAGLRQLPQGRPAVAVGKRRGMPWPAWRAARSVAAVTVISWLLCPAGRLQARPPVGTPSGSWPRPPPRVRPGPRRSGTGSARWWIPGWPRRIGMTRRSGRCSISSAAPLGSRPRERERPAHVCAEGFEAGSSVDVVSLSDIPHHLFLPSLFFLLRKPMFLTDTIKFSPQHFRVS
ncbi:hypothetical protein VTO42DRAFT_3414 [Malbranchea cinnamomea]